LNTLIAYFKARSGVFYSVIYGVQQANIENNTPFQILITGVEGRAQINGERCQLDARWPTGGSRVESFRGGGVAIEQPLFPEAGRAILSRIGASETIRFSLDKVFFTGTIEDTQTALPKSRAGRTFDVDSSGIAQEHSQASFQVRVLRK
jgi:hypothetical protein